MEKLMVVVIALCIAVQQTIDSFITGENLWYASQFLSMVQTSSALAFLTAVIPYRRLFLKTIAGVWCATLVTDCIVYPLWFVCPHVATYAHPLQFMVSVVFFFYICVKSYNNIESDIVVPGYIYQVRAIPANFQDVLLSVVYLRPFGGTGVICAGNWYHYRKGRLVCSPATQIPLNKCIILRTRKETTDDKTTLDNLITEEWSWTRNCVTLLHPFSLRK